MAFALLEKENKAIANLAATGPYGAGKSSVVEACGAGENEEIK